ncbi:MAG: hypothetical protein ABIF82_01985 [Planctomycetota bacterium]
MAKAIALLSGGLDSQLAINVIKEQGIEVACLNFVTLFCRCTSNKGCKLEAVVAGERLGVPVKVINSGREFLEIVKHPQHGRGKNMNPCIDCRIFMFKRAGEYMRETGADFIFTGEVLGQRPMSQRKDAMRQIDRAAGLTGYVLRPLCAKHLDPTVPEKDGLVDREKLLSIRGRSRKEQFALADVFHLKDFPCPAGGCLLTDPQFGWRLRDLLDHTDPDMNDVHLLKLGRHFRLDDATKVIVGREEGENAKIETFARAGDLLLDAADVAGPTVLLRGDASGGNVATAARLTVKYGKAHNEPSAQVVVRRARTDEGFVVDASPAAEEEARQLMIMRDGK